MRQTIMFSHVSQGPMVGPFGLAFQDCLDDCGNLVIGNRLRSVTQVMVIQTINPARDKAAALLANRFITEIQFNGNVGVAMPIGTMQYARVAV